MTDTASASAITPTQVLTGAWSDLLTPATINTSAIIQAVVREQQLLNLQVWELTEKLREAANATVVQQREVEAYAARLKATKMRADAINKQLLVIKGRLIKVHERLRSRTQSLKRDNDTLREELTEEKRTAAMAQRAAAKAAATAAAAAPPAAAPAAAAAPPAAAPAAAAVAEQPADAALPVVEEKLAEAVEEAPAEKAAEQHVDPTPVADEAETEQLASSSTPAADKEEGADGAKEEEPAQPEASEEVKDAEEQSPVEAEDAAEEEPASTANAAAAGKGKGKGKKGKK